VSDLKDWSLDTASTVQAHEKETNEDRRRRSKMLGRQQLWTAGHLSFA
jgi:hypothetical protein